MYVNIFACWPFISYCIFEQVDATASSLNSNDAYILKNARNAYMWVGKGASKEEECGAEYMSELLQCKIQRITEGQEPGKRTLLMSIVKTGILLKKPIL